MLSCAAEKSHSSCTSEEARSFTTVPPTLSLVFHKTGIFCVLMFLHVCVSICPFTHPFVYLSMHMEPEMMLGVFNHSPPFFFFFKSESVADWLVISGDHLLPPTPVATDTDTDPHTHACTHTTMSSLPHVSPLHMGVGDPDPGSHTCTIGTLPSEISPQLIVKNSFKLGGTQALPSQGARTELKDPQILTRL